MKKLIEFKELEPGDVFECYGDVHLNYNTRTLSECIKLDANTAREIDGIIFNIRDIDTVFKLGADNEGKEENLKRIEDFPGVVILANEHGVITQEKLNWAIKHYVTYGNGITDNFTEWLSTEPIADRIINK